MLNIMSDINEITQAKFVSAVDEKYSILHKQISDHPNFDIQKINREVVLGKVSIKLKFKKYSNYMKKFCIFTKL